MLKIGSLFGGYGGIELGLEKTGFFRTIWHSEIESYPSAILKERWPGIPNLGDITKINWKKVEKPDIIVGGFPCQDISIAGKQRGIIKGETRSGLWGEFHKAIRILRPRFVLIENVSAIARLGLDIVLADLAQEGYDAEWLDIRASDFGAPHKRERIFIVAYPHSHKKRHLVGEFEEHSTKGRESSQREPEQLCADVSDSHEERRNDRGNNREKRSVQATPERSIEEDYKERDGREHRISEVREVLSDSHLSGLQEHQQRKRQEKAQPSFEQHCGWETEPGMDRVVDGITKGLDSYIWRERIKALGNGVVPQITEWIGKKIIEEVVHYS